MGESPAKAATQVAGQRVGFTHGRRNDAVAVLKQWHGLGQLPSGEHFPGGNHLLVVIWKAGISVANVGFR